MCYHIVIMKPKFTPKLLTRTQFRDAVFARDKHKCVFCDKPALDAHHLLERRLFGESQGYFLENGASVCEEHHLACERTDISVEQVREICGITKTVLPSHFYEDQIYDKWGNIVLPNGQRLKGELFHDENVQKIISSHLSLFSEYVKYPRTHHVPWSDGMNEDDKMIESMNSFTGCRVIVTEKLDGENCLDEDTLIQTNCGVKKIKEICDLKLNAKVLSFNHEINETEYQQIENHFINESKNDEWYEIELENNVKLKLTGNHKIWINNLNCYRQVKDLIGDEDLYFEKVDTFTTLP